MLRAVAADAGVAAVRNAFLWSLDAEMAVGAVTVVLRRAEGRDEDVGETERRVRALLATAASEVTVEVEVESEGRHADEPLTPTAARTAASFRAAAQSPNAPLI